MAATGKWKKMYTAIIAVVFIASLYVFYRVKKHSFLDDKLQEMVNSKTKGLYNLTYDSIFVNEARGHLYIRNVHVKADTALQLALINGGDTNAAKMLLDIFIPELKVERFKTASALLSKEMECDSIYISNPKIAVYIFPGQKNEKDIKTQKEELYKQILGGLKLIKAQSVLVTNGEVVATDFFSKEKKFQAYQTTINLTDVAIDSTYNQDPSRTLFCKEIDINAGKVILGDKMNTAEITGAAFDTRSKIIALASFQYDSYKNGGFFKTAVNGIALEGFEWNGPVENSVVVIDKLTLAKGDVDAMPGRKQGGEKKSNNNILTGWIKSFTINTLNVKSVDYTSRSADAKEKPSVLKNNSFFLSNIHINRASKFDESLINEAKEIELSNDEIKITSPDNRYQFRFVDVKINSKAKRISVKKIQVIPLLSEAAFAKIARYQVDRYDINFFNLVCSNVDVGKFIKGEISIDNITTSNSTVKVFRDLSYPIDSVSRRSASETFPHQLIHKVSAPLSVRKFVVNNLYLEYKEKNPLSQSSGRVRFAKSTLTVTNISNATAKKDEQMVARFSTLFLDQIPMNGAFTFYMDEWKKGKFKAEASVQKEVDARLLSELTEPLSLARIDKGTINSLSFRTVADTGTSNGHLEFSYKDLKVSLLKKKGNEYAKKDAMSFLANILVKNKNKEGEGMRTADVEVSRNKYKSFFNYIWITVFKGLRQTITIKI